MASSTGSVGGSTLDVQGLVNQLMTVERQPLVKLQQSETKLQSRISALGSIQSKLAAMRTAASSLSSLTTFNATKATTTGDSAQVAVTGAPVPGSFDIAVSKLARAQTYATAGSDPAAALGVGTLTLAAGGKTVAIDVGGTDQPNTLAGLRDAINGQTDVPVTATMISAGGQSRLVMTAKSTGLANGFTATAGGALSSLGLAASQPAQDAEFTINGLSLNSPTNTIKDAVDGVTLVLAKAPPAGSAPGTTADSNVTIARDPESVKGKVNDFISAYNGAISQIRSQTSYDAASKTAGPLNGESVLRSAQSTVSSIVRGNMTAAQVGDYTRLADIGIQTQRDGTLTLDSKAFDAAMAGDPARVQRLLAGPTGATGSARGLAAQLRDQLDSISGTTGSLQTRTDGLRSQIKTLDRKQEQQQARLDLTRKRLLAQYSKLDTLLSTRQTDSNALANALARL